MKLCVLVTLYKPNREHLRSNITEFLSYSERVFLLNNSTENFNEFVSGSVEVVSNITNIGISRAVNIGIEHANRQGFDFAILFDQDSYLPNAMFELLWREFSELSRRERVACIGPSVKVRGNLILVPRWSRRTEKPNHNCLEVYNIITSGMLVSIDTFRSLGGFEEWFPVDFSDFTYCWKSIDRGFKVFQSRDAILTHEIGNHGLRIHKGTIHFHSFYRNYFLVRDTLNVCLRRSETPIMIRIRFLYQLPIRMLLFVLILDRRYRRLQMYTLGIIDFLRGVHGFGSIRSILGADK